jgi:23S rRNA pseudouridine1911/1915/1917 synthase
MALNHGWTYRDQVPKSAVGQTLLDFYTQRYRHSSRAAWRQRIETGHVKVDDQLGQCDQPLMANQQLAYDRPPWHEPDVPLDFAVLYEDDDVLAIHKPSGLPVLPGGGFLEHTLLHQLQLHYPEATPSPVHRLGRGTSGVMLLARSPLAKSSLSQQFRQSTQSQTTGRPIQKTYRALIGPSDLPKTFVIEAPIGQVPYPILGHLFAATPNGKPAYSEGRVIHRSKRSTLLEVMIHTGRPHQIRIHLASIGYPLLHDPLYGPGGVPYPVDSAAKHVITPGDGGYWLHAYRIGFVHPRWRSPQVITASPPRSLDSASIAEKG